MMLITPFLACTKTNYSEFLIENLNDFSTEYSSVTIPYSIDDFPTSFVLVDQNGTEIPYQLDDLDQDGEPETLFFQLSLDANSSANISVHETQNKPEFAFNTDITIKVRDKKDPENMQVSSDFQSVQQYTETFD